MAEQTHRAGYRRPQAATTGMMTPARTTIAPGVYQGKQQMLADALLQSRSAAQQGPQDIGAQVGQALNTIGTSYMAGANERAGQAERTAANDTAKAALAAALRGEPLDAGAIDAIGSEWVDPGYQSVIGQLLAQQMDPGETDLVQAVGPDGQMTWVPKAQAAGMASALPPTAEPGKSRQIHRNGMIVDQEFDPATKSWNDVGQGPQFAPNQPREPRQRTIMTLYGPNGQAKSLYDDDPSLPGLLQQGWIDDKPASDTVMVQTGVDANGNPIFEMKSAGGTKTTQDQEKSGQLYTVMAPELEIVESTFDALASPVGQGLSVLPGGNALQTEDYQRAKKAVSTIVASYLYVTSGATANPGEIETQVGLLMPEFGDKPGNLEDKKQRIRTMVQSVADRAGQGAPINTGGGGGPVDYSTMSDQELLDYIAKHPNG